VRAEPQEAAEEHAIHKVVGGDVVGLVRQSHLAHVAEGLDADVWQVDTTPPSTVVTVILGQSLSFDTMFPL
jgi:hypothetical protein